MDDSTSFKPELANFTVLIATTMALAVLDHERNEQLVARPLH